MTFQELLQKYPYLNDCREDKALPKVICKYRIYNEKNEEQTSWETPMSVTSILTHPYLQKDMGCGCTNEYDRLNMFYKPLASAMGIGA